MENNIIKDEKILTYIRQADNVLFSMKFTEHNLAHVSRVSNMACKLLKDLGYDDVVLKLTEIACYLHDIGNIINRHDHAHYGALLARDLLLEKDIPLEHIIKIMSAIGNHDESSGVPVSEMSAALILADKADIRRSRVRKLDTNLFDIHDRVNYSVDSSILSVNKDKKFIILELTLNNEYSSILEFLSIFSSRMEFCKKAAEYFGYKFCLCINGVILSN